MIERQYFACRNQRCKDHRLPRVQRGACVGCGMPLVLALIFTGRGS